MKVIISSSTMTVLVSPANIAAITGNPLCWGSMGWIVYETLLKKSANVNTCTQENINHKCITLQYYM